jgi:hypothetical protein
MKSTKITSLIESLDAKNSEDLFGFAQQPNNQCPYIDKSKEEIFSLIKNISNLCKDIKSSDDLSDIYSCCNDIIWEIDMFSVSKNLEDLRTEIENLRGWGNEWKCLAKNLVERTKDIELEDLISDEFYIKSQELINNT